MDLRRFELLVCCHLALGQRVDIVGTFDIARFCNALHRIGNADADKQIKAIGDGINDVNAGFSFDDAAVYDLSGRKVSKAQKGIYIVNGKKVMVK